MCGLFRMSSSISIEMACGVRAGQTGPGRWKCVCVCVCWPVISWAVCLSGADTACPVRRWMGTDLTECHTRSHTQTRTQAQRLTSQIHLCLVTQCSWEKHTHKHRNTELGSESSELESRWHRRFQMDFLGQTLILCCDLHWQIFDAINHIWLAGSACAMEGGERRRFGRSS